jgi:hypothetical protein
MEAFAGLLTGVIQEEEKECALSAFLFEGRDNEHPKEDFLTDDDRRMIASHLYCELFELNIFSFDRPSHCEDLQSAVANLFRPSPEASSSEQAKLENAFSRDLSHALRVPEDSRSPLKRKFDDAAFYEKARLARSKYSSHRKILEKEIVSLGIKPSSAKRVVYSFVDMLTGFHPVKLPKKDSLFLDNFFEMVGDSTEEYKAWIASLSHHEKTFDGHTAFACIRLMVRIGKERLAEVLPSFD